MDMNELIIGTLMYVIVGFVFLGIGIGTLVKKRKGYKVCTAVTTGSVKEFVRHVHSASHTSMDPKICYPVIEFYANGQNYEVRSSYGTTKPRFEIGQKVEIHYNPAKPSDFFIEGDSIPKKLSIAFILAGTGAIIGAFVFWFAGA